MIPDGTCWSGLFKVEMLRILKLELKLGSCGYRPGEALYESLLMTCEGLLLMIFIMLPAPTYCGCFDLELFALCPLSGAVLEFGDSSIPGTGCFGWSTSCSCSISIS